VIVIDASLAFNVCVAERSHQQAADLIAQQDQPLGGPELIELEFLQTLRRTVLSGAIDEDFAEKARQRFRTLQIFTFSHAQFTDRIWALRDNLTAYDAAYIAIAEHIDAPLWTSDQKLATRVGHLVEIVIV